jgi:molybdopterin-guanine dinucleotide biosynthesis protein A
MLGLVLCGGLSSRMGSDKGLISSRETTWAGYLTKQIKALNLAFKVSVNDGQLTTYTKYFDEVSLIKDDKNLSLKGPLLGIISAHSKFPLEDLLVIACDMQLMQSHFLSKLIEVQSQKPSYDVSLFTNNGIREPLCGIYTAKSLANLLAIITSNGLQSYSMKAALNLLTVYEMPIESKYVTNLNAEEDIRNLSSI